MFILLRSLIDHSGFVFDVEQSKGPSDEAKVDSKVLSSVFLFFLWLSFNGVKQCQNCTFLTVSS